MLKINFFFFQNGNGNSATTMTNPVAKPPRLTDLHPSFNTTGQISSNGSLTINGTVFHPADGETYNTENGRAIGNSTSNPGSKFKYLTTFIIFLISCLFMVLYLFFLSFGFWKPINFCQWLNSFLQYKCVDRENKYFNLNF